MAFSRKWPIFRNYPNKTKLLKHPPTHQDTVGLWKSCPPPTLPQFIKSSLLARLFLPRSTHRPEHRMLHANFVHVIMDLKISLFAVLFCYNMPPVSSIAAYYRRNRCVHPDGWAELLSLSLSSPRIVLDGRVIKIKWIIFAPFSNKLVATSSKMLSTGGKRRVLNSMTNIFALCQKNALQSRPWTGWVVNRKMSTCFYGN